MTSPVRRGRAVGRRLLARTARRVAGPSEVRPPLPQGLRAAFALVRLKPDAVVAVLATTGDVSATVDAVLHHLDGRTVHVVADRAEPEWGLERHGRAGLAQAVNLVETNWQLKRLGPVDAIVDLSRDPTFAHEPTWRRLFYHLRHGGLYVAVLPGQPGESDDARALARMVAGFGAARAAGTNVDVPQPDRDLARATAQVLLRNDVVAAVKRGDHFLKLRHDEVDRMLPARNVDATSTLLTTVPGGTHTSRAEVISHGRPSPWGLLSPTYDYPAVRMRRYTGRIAMATHSLLYADETVLPESFRHHLRMPLHNVKIKDVSPEFAQVSNELRPTQHLDGSFFHLDTPFPGHFGHVMTEMLSRLWGWDEAKRRDPALKMLLRMPYRNHRDPTLEHALLGAYGVAPDDIVFTDAPVWVDSIVGVTPMFHNQFPHHAHPALAEVYARISDNLAVLPTRPRPRIFVSRLSNLRNRPCRNLAEVEAFFVAHGFEIVHPETMSTAEQAGLFAQAEVVAGFGGSGLFNLMFCRNLSRMILLSHTAYDARNEYLIASVTGAQLHYFWSEPEVAHPVGGWASEAFESGWTFDFDADGAELAALLDTPLDSTV